MSDKIDIKKLVSNAGSRKQAFADFQEAFKGKQSKSEEDEFFSQLNRYYKPKKDSADSDTNTYSNDNKEPKDNKKFSEIWKEITSGGAKITSELLTSQMGQENNKNLFEPTSEILDSIQKKGLTLGAAWDFIKESAQSITDQLKIESELQSEINSKTSLTGELSKSFREDLVASSAYAAKFGYDVKDLGQIYTALVESSGKFNLLNRDTFEMAAPLARAFDMNMTRLGETISTFSDVGIGANKTIEKLGEAGIKSNALGLSGKKIISDIQQNIGKLNEYGFKNGIDGLTKMVQKANEFKMSLESIGRLTDKVFEPEGALDLVANLQVLGGAVGDLNDPLKLMYMATNNVEGLQDALIGAASGLATYNEEQGRFEVTGVNLRLAKARADALGISLGEMNKMAIASAERTAAATALMSTGLQMKDEDKEFLTNLASMEGGQMVIKIPEDIAEKIGAPTQLALDQLTETQKEGLLKYKDELSKMDTATIAEKQLTETQQLVREVQAIAQSLRIRAARGVRSLGKEVLGSTVVSANEKLRKETEDIKNVKYYKTEEYIKDLFSDEKKQKETEKKETSSLTKGDMTSAFVDAFNMTKYSNRTTTNNYVSNDQFNIPYLQQGMS